MAEVVVTEEGERYTQKIVAGGRHRLLADEPAEKGGKDAGPNPYELLLSALGACTSITVRMYADLKRIPLRRVSVRLRHEKVPAEECQDCETKEGKVDVIEQEVTLEGDLSAEQHARLMEIAGRCPVHRTLQGEVKIRSRA
ncbi:MAG TPA: OsmC family protein [Planctomycetota bacterium]|nr:OsmC family protein [Planctomycetota bacterium]